MLFAIAYRSSIINRPPFILYSTKFKSANIFRHLKLKRQTNKQNNDEENLVINQQFKEHRIIILMFSTEVY